MRAEVEAVNGALGVVSDYWSLVYSARRHNRSPQYWVVLAAPLAVDGVGEPVRVVELSAPEPVDDFPGGARYFSASFEELKTSSLETFDKVLLPGAAEFRRGDTRADGRLNIVDAVLVLEHLFRGGTLACVKAADANDNGRVETGDAIVILQALFGKRASGIAAPTPACGRDATDDILSCTTYAACDA